MHGNVAEWTRTTYRPYPYALSDGPDDEAGPKVVRGGSWRDRPYRATSSFRLAYPPYQRVFNVGFRVACLAAPRSDPDAS
jgi:formylglycine-generating enzyme required for sulfatase activity